MDSNSKLSTCRTVLLAGDYTATLIGGGDCMFGVLTRNGEKAANTYQKNGTEESVLATLLHVENYPPGFVNADRARQLAEDLLSC